MRHLLFIILLLGCVGVWAQSSFGARNSAASNRQNQGQASSSASKPAPAPRPNLEPPRSDRVNADALETGESSSKDSPVDLSAPANDSQAHPKSSEVLEDAEGVAGSGDVDEFHPWDPHKAAKDIEVGDFYFKRKNYKAAEDRYREALYYKDSDAIARFRLAVCLDKMDRPDEALKEYEAYLKILPYGPEAPQARKAIERLKGLAANTKPAK